MLHSCGQSHLNRFGIGPSYDHDHEVKEYFVQPLAPTHTQLYTAYLGLVTTEVTGTGGDFVSLETYHSVGGKQIHVKVIDSVENNISDKFQYNLNYLNSLPAKKINITDNKYYYFLTQLCNKKFAQLNYNSELIQKINCILQPFIINPTLVARVSSQYPALISEFPTRSPGEYKKLFQQIVQNNDPVDIFFNTTNYLDFLFSTTKLTSVAHLDSLISICNVPNLDNAFFTGQYMVFGAGDKMFYPLSSIDVVGHELSHGLVSGTANLEYKGHSGALNESFSDIMGTMCEFYMYDKYPQLNGKSDWFIGEDLAINTPFLRSMKDPNSAQQPNKYKGLYYLDPNSQIDNGGVHINSGIPNYCFYLASQQKDKSQVLNIFLNCLYSLKNSSNFIDFRDKLIIASNSDPILLNALKTVGLNPGITSDYPILPTPFPRPQTQPIPIPRPSTPRFISPDQDF